MSPKKESRRSSPRKSEEPLSVSSSILSNSENVEKGPVSPSKNGTSKGSGLKLRLKVKSNSDETVGSVPFTDLSIINPATSDTNATASATTNNTPTTTTSIKIIKLNFSRSNESVPEPQQPEVKKKGKRGRPKKDKSAVMAAALAASQPNAIESEERRKRRRAAEDKIKRSASMDSVSNNNTVVVVDEDARERGKSRKSSESVGNDPSGADDSSRKRRRRRKGHGDDVDSHGSGSKESIGSMRRSRSNDYVDITETQENTKTSATPSSTPFNPHETEFIQRSKTFLNISLQHDSFIYTSLLTNPMEVDAFKSAEDMVEKLAAFHVGFGAGQYISEELNSSNVPIVSSTDHLETFSTLQDRYRQVIHSHSSKKVPTELLLLEQRLCLEEEKFLLVKLKNEYAARFLKPTTSGSGSAAGSSRSSTPST